MILIMILKYYFDQKKIKGFNDLIFLEYYL
jgi:hypothetical protein